VQPLQGDIDQSSEEHLQDSYDYYDKQPYDT
jgi:hypothetical protein